MRATDPQTRCMRHDRFVLRCVVAAAFALVVSACSASSVPPPPPSGPHLYAAEPSANHVAGLSLPLTMTSMAAFNISGFNFNSGVAFDAARNLYVSNTGGASIAVFNPPYTVTSAPAFTVAGASSLLVAPEQIGFDASGDLWVADQTAKVLEFVPPFSASSAPALTVSNSITSAQGVAFDSAQNLYVADNNATLDVFTPPYNASPTQTMNGLIFPLAVVTDAAHVYVADFGNKGVAVFNLPVASGVAPAFTMTNGLGNGPHGLTFDGSGNLYVSTNAGEIVLFMPPFSAASTPVLTVSCFVSPSSNCLTRQMAFGP